MYGLSLLLPSVEETLFGFNFLIGVLLTVPAKMLLNKLAGKPYTTEFPMPSFDRVAPGAAITDLAHTTIALVTSGGIVPKGNPDHIESSSASKYGQYDIEGVMAVLNKKSGVFGLSGGLSSDFRDLTDAMNAGDKKAKIAMDVFSYRVAKYIGAYAAAMNGVDCIAFTAGVGENDDYVREQVCSYLGYLGVDFDKEVNDGLRGEEKELTKPGSKVRVFVIPTNEELAIARETLALVK